MITEIQELLNLLQIHLLIGYKHFQSSSTFLNKMKEIEVDIPIDKITIGGGYSDDVTESEKFEQLIARYLSGSNNAKYELSEVIKSINPTIVDAWQKMYK